MLERVVRRASCRASTTPRCAAADGEPALRGVPHPRGLRRAVHASSTTSAGRTRSAVAAPTHGWQLPAAAPPRGRWPSGTTRRRSWPRQGGRSSTRACRCCSTTTWCWRAFTRPRPTRSTSSTATATICSTCSRAAACCARRSAICASAEGDYVFVPRGHPAPLHPGRGRAAVLAVDRVPGRPAPAKQWRNEAGQLRMDAPYCHRDFRAPELRRPARRGHARAGGQARRRLPRLRATTHRRWTWSAGTARCTRGPSPSWHFQPRVGLGAPAAHLARHVRGARGADLQLRAAAARLPPRGHPLPVPALARWTATSSSSTRGATSPRAGRGAGQHLAPPGRHAARPAPGRLRGQHRATAAPTSWR